MPHMVKSNSETGFLLISSLSSTWLNSMAISAWQSFQQEPHWGCRYVRGEWEMGVISGIWILCYQLINMGKLYNDLNQKSIINNNTLDDLHCKLTLCKNQEVASLSSDRRTHSSWSYRQWLRASFSNKI